MPSTKDILLFSTNAFFFLSGTLAKPTGIVPAAPLGRRFLESVNGCDEGQEKKLRQDFADAANFALHAYDGVGKDHAAFKHYFRTEGGGSDEDILQVQHMWSTIAANNDPTNPPYIFSVRCAAKDDKECKSRTTQSYAITDAQPQDGNTARQMLICPLYFTGDATKKSITSHEWKPNAKRRDNSWCKPGAKFRDFSMGGLTLLHEMTHLDAVAKSAGYPSVQYKVPINYTKIHRLIDARNLAKIWQQGEEGNYNELTQPFRNAESIAAAALEVYVMKFCELGNVDI